MAGVFDTQGLDSTDDEGDEGGAPLVGAPPHGYGFNGAAPTGGGAATAAAHAPPPAPGGNYGAGPAYAVANDHSTPQPGEPWNEALVRALTARYNQAQRKGTGREFMWYQAITEIQKVRKDIKLQKNKKKIVNLPMKELKQNVYQICEKIIRGDEPLYPVGHIAGDETKAQAIGTMATSHVQKMKYRSGQYAILMAFSDLNALHRVAYKAELCKAGQKHCDSPMKADYMRGQQFGAWKAIDQLEKRGLVVRTKNFGAGVNFTASKHTFSLTDEGRGVVAAVREKWGGGGGGGGGAAGAGGAAATSSGWKTPSGKAASGWSSTPGGHRLGGGGGGSTGGGGHWVPPSAGSGAGAAAAAYTPAAAAAVGGGGGVKKGRRTQAELTADDETTLRTWLTDRSTVTGKIIMMNVGKKRREILHTETIPKLEAEFGVSLSHVGVGEGGDRQLRVMVLTPGYAGRGLAAAAAAASLGHHMSNPVHGGAHGGWGVDPAMHTGDNGKRPRGGDHWEDEASSPKRMAAAAAAQRYNSGSHPTPSHLHHGGGYSGGGFDGGYGDNGGFGNSTSTAYDGAHSHHPGGGRSSHDHYNRDHPMGNSSGYRSGGGGHTHDYTVHGHSGGYGSSGVKMEVDPLLAVASEQAEAEAERKRRAAERKEREELELALAVSASKKPLSPDRLAERKRRAAAEKEREELELALAVSASADSTTKPSVARVASSVHVGESAGLATAGPVAQGEDAATRARREQEELDYAMALSLSTSGPSPPPPRHPPATRRSRDPAPTVAEEDSVQFLDDDDEDTAEGMDKRGGGAAMEETMEESVQLLGDYSESVATTGLPEEEDSVQLLDDSESWTDPPAESAGTAALPRHTGGSLATGTSPSARGMGKRKAAPSNPVESLLASLSDSDDDDLPCVSIGGPTATFSSTPRQRSYSHTTSLSTASSSSFGAHQPGGTPRGGSGVPGARAAAAPRRAVSTPGARRQTPLRAFTVLVDTRERTKNATPREMMDLLRTECADRWATQFVRGGGWSGDEVACGVAQQKLTYGDFGFISGGGGGAQPSAVAIERKTVSDLVGRSAKGDHIRQLDKMVQIMEHCFFNLEGDPKLAAGYTAYGASEHTANDNIHNVADVYALFCRVVLEYSGQVKILQTPNILATCQAVHFLGLLLQSRYHAAPIRATPNVKLGDTRKDFASALRADGMPKDVALQVVRRFRSRTVLADAYARCESDRCRSALLVGWLQAGGISHPQAWSHVVWKLQSVPPSDTVAGMQRMQLDFGSRPRAVLLAVLLDHGLDPASAGAALRGGATGSGLMPDNTHRRAVVEVGPGVEALWGQGVLLPNETVEFLQQPDGIHGRREAIRVTAACGPLRSAGVALHVVRGPELVHYLEHELPVVQGRPAAERSLVTAVETCAAVLAASLGALPSGSEGEPMVVITQGISQALNKWASDAGKPAQNEMPVCVPGVLTALQLHHHVVVLNATTKEAVKDLLGAFWCEARDRLLLNRESGASKP